MADTVQPEPDPNQGDRCPLRASQKALPVHSGTVRRPPCANPSGPSPAKRSRRPSPESWDVWSASRTKALQKTAGGRLAHRPSIQRGQPQQGNTPPQPKEGHNIAHRPPG